MVGVVQAERHDDARLHRWEPRHQSFRDLPSVGQGQGLAVVGGHGVMHRAGIGHARAPHAAASSSASATIRQSSRPIPAISAFTL